MEFESKRRFSVVEIEAANNCSLGARVSTMISVAEWLILSEIFIICIEGVDEVKIVGQLI